MAVQYGRAASYQVQLKGPYGSVSIRVSEVALKVADWKGAVSPYAQTVAVDGVTATSKVDLQPGAEELEKLRLGNTAFAAENDNGLVTVYAFGERPVEDLSFQATVTEVQR